MTSQPYSYPIPQAHSQLVSEFMAVLREQFVYFAFRDPTMQNNNGYEAIRVHAVIDLPKVGEFSVLTFVPVEYVENSIMASVASIESDLRNAIAFKLVPIVS